MLLSLYVALISLTLQTHLTEKCASAVNQQILCDMYTCIYSSHVNAQVDVVYMLLIK